MIPQASGSSTDDEGGRAGRAGRKHSPKELTSKPRPAGWTGPSRVRGDEKGKKSHRPHDRGSRRVGRRGQESRAEALTGLHL